MRELRPHQSFAIEQLRLALRSGSKRPMVMAPTGAGKTVLAAALIDMALAKGSRCIFTVPAIPLIDQTAREFWNEGIRDVGVIQADHPMTDPTKPVQIASVQTLRRREIPEADLVIVDEAHRISRFVEDWMSREEWLGVPFIGLSATPWSKGLGRLYDRLIIAATTKQLIEQGYLSDFRVFAPTKPDLTGVRIRRGDYDPEQLSEVMCDRTLTADIVQTWADTAEGRPTLCFAVDRVHARTIQAQFEAAGIPCGYLDGTSTRDEREEVRKAFAAGKFKVVCNVGVLTTGVDWDVRCIILARPTKSEILYCLDAETEILTSHGWKGMGEVRLGDCAASLADPASGRGEWSRIVGVVERDMEPAERWVEYAAPRANFRVTDQHTMIAASMNDKARAYRAMPAAELASLPGGVKLPTAVHMSQVGVPLTDAELYFIGMMMADGTWTSTAGSITQSERHPAILEAIEANLQACGIAYSKSREPAPEEGVVERHPRWRFNFSAGKPRAHGNTGRGPVPTRRDYTRVDGVTGFQHLLPYLDKDMAPALMAMSRSQLDRLLDGLWDGDGSKKLGVDYSPKSREICSARPLLMDRLQALCAINGYTANVRKEHGPSRNTPIWLITVTRKDWRSCGGYSTAGRDPRPQISVSPATKERVWCVQTEAGTIVTRRRGKVTVMGNCQIIGRGLRTADGKDDCLILDHSDTTLRLGFVTDIHHASLNDGTIAEGTRPEGEREPPKPKECPKCKYVRAAGVPHCPNCGHVPERTTEVQTRDGELVEIKGAKKANREVEWPEKIAFMRQLKAYEVEKGFKRGWAANKYRTKFGVWPNDPRVSHVQPAAGISKEVRSWIVSQNIRHAKAKQKSANYEMEIMG